MTNNKIKVAKIVLFVSLIICVVFSITLIVSSVKLDYAEEHYESNYRIHKETTNKGSLLQKMNNGYYNEVYGCGDIDCKYCNGRKSVKNGFDNFVYYKTYSSLKTASIVILCVSSGLLATCLLCFAIPKKEQ